VFASQGRSSTIWRCVLPFNDERLCSGAAMAVTPGERADSHTSNRHRVLLDTIGLSCDGSAGLAIKRIEDSRSISGYRACHRCCANRLTIACFSNVSQCASAKGSLAAADATATGHNARRA
jgi:hypothetical protein